MFQKKILCHLKHGFHQFLHYKLCNWSCDKKICIEWHESKHNSNIITELLCHLQHVVSLNLFQSFHFLSRLSFKNSQLKFWLQKCFGWQKSIMHFKPKIFLSCYFKQTFFKYAVSQNVILNFFSHIYTILRNIS